MQGRHYYLTETQRRRLQDALEGLNSETALSITELEGFLHGLVITPDLVGPSEWIPVVFDTDTPEFGSEDRQQDVFTAIFDAYDTYEKARTNNLLRFPFDIEMFSEAMLYEIQQWCYGFMEALSLRPEIWFLGLDDLSEMEQTVVSAVSIISVLAYLEDIIQYLKENNLIKILSMAIFTVPSAVEVLQSYGNTLWKQKIQEMNGGIFDFKPKKKKIGRNEPCPCGSGKKYKKCCGRN